ncbi:uncharacterized protein [Rutidosis leptorrhynchoides]|uniref:uncharacterized protein n=1 Tax=Rutidosis leptorrhynchoides TaxID=125765 RepID=UPI003A99FCD4
MSGGLDGGGIQGNGTWPTIVNLFSKLKRMGHIPDDVLRTKIGNGINTKFWLDNWRGYGSLKQKFPRLFHIESHKECVIADRIGQNGKIWNWTRSNIGPRNEALVRELEIILGPITLATNADYSKRRVSSDGLFHVGETRSFIDDNVLAGSAVRTRWPKEVPRKVNVLIWRIALDWLLTRLNFSRRGMEIEDIHCNVCKYMVESTNHLFFESSLTCEIWAKINVWVDVRWLDCSS